MIRLKQDDTTTTSRLLVECLENEGVRYIFGIPGEENLELMSELKNSKIKFITTRHEQGAAFWSEPRPPSSPVARQSRGGHPHQHERGDQRHVRRYSVGHELLG